jgi:hypothetical protein
LRWEEKWREKKRLRLAADKIVRRWQQILLAPAMLQWEEKWREKKRLMLAADKIVRRWQQILLAPAMLRWEEKWREKKRLMLAADKIVRRWQQILLAPAMLRWEEKWREERKMRQVAEKIVRRWQQILLAQGLMRWKEQLRKVRRRRGALMTALMNARRAVAAAWSVWKEETSARVRKFLCALVASLRKSVGHVRLQSCVRLVSRALDPLLQCRSTALLTFLRCCTIPTRSKWQAWREKSEARMAYSRTVRSRREQQVVMRCFLEWQRLAETHGRQKEVCSYSVSRSLIVTYRCALNNWATAVRAR